MFYETVLNSTCTHVLSSFSTYFVIWSSIYSLALLLKLFCVYFPECSWIVNTLLFLSCSLLVRQLVEPVNWMKTIQTIFKGRTRNCKIYEVGPGKQLRATINRIDRTLLDNFINIETWHNMLQKFRMVKFWI